MMQPYPRRPRCKLPSFLWTAEERYEEEVRTWAARRSDAVKSRAKTRAVSAYLVQPTPPTRLERALSAIGGGIRLVHPTTFLIGMFTGAAAYQFAWKWAL